MDRVILGICMLYKKLVTLALVDSGLPVSTDYFQFIRNRRARVLKISVADAMKPN